jgi:uncharacterized membrane protein YeiH
MTGVLVFAVSGVLTALDNEFDVVGASVIGFITALGGGTLRDILIGETPVGWMKDTNYLIAIFTAMILAYLFKNRIQNLRKSWFVFDTIGIGTFTVLGVQKTIEAGLSPVIAVLMGIVSATFGGVLRDVLTNEVPLIFRREIYATACLAGAVVYLMLEQFIEIQQLNISLAIGLVLIIRYFAVKRKWMLNFRGR